MANKSILDVDVNASSLPDDAFFINSNQSLKQIKKNNIRFDYDTHIENIIQRAKAMIPILVPLFVSAFRRANDLAMAMEARCYRGGEGRTKMKPLVYHSRDRVAYLVTAVYLAVIIVLGRFVPFHIWIF